MRRSLIVVTAGVCLTLVDEEGSDVGEYLSRQSENSLQSCTGGFYIKSRQCNVSFAISSHQLRVLGEQLKSIEEEG